MCHGAKIQNALSQKNLIGRIVVHIKITRELPQYGDYFIFQDEILKPFVTHFYASHITESDIFGLRTE